MKFNELNFIRLILYYFTSLQDLFQKVGKQDNPFPDAIRRHEGKIEPHGIAAASIGAENEPATYATPLLSAVS